MGKLVGLVSLQVLLLPLTRAGPWPVPGGIAWEPLVAGSRMPWGWGQPLQCQGSYNLLQALFKLGKKVKYHLRTHEQHVDNLPVC